MAAKSLKRERDASQQDPESGAPPKRQRQEDAQLAKLYDDLASESDETRLGAAKQLIVKFSPENKPTAQAVEKALNRLIRGLCSGRKAARFGYCVTLTELLRLLFGQQENPIEGLQIRTNDLIDLVIEQTKVKGKVPGKERRDYLIGKLFGCKAIIQSRVLTEPCLSLDSWNKVLDQICELARDMPWLREECGLVLVEAVNSLGGDVKLRQCAEQVIPRLTSFNLVNTPEGVAIWLSLKAKFEDVLPSGIWNDQDPLSKKERGRLAKILKEDFRRAEGDEGETVKSAAANPNPIFAWDLVLSEMLRRDTAKATSKEGSKPDFPQFWLDTVDSNLFSATASHERKSWGFKLFASRVRTVPEGVISALFSPNLMRSLINQSKKDDRFLHSAALTALGALQERVQQQPASALPIFTALTGKTGTIDLDRLTKTKTLANIMLATDDQTLRKIVKYLQTIILRPDTQDQAIADSRRQTIADMLLGLVKAYKGYEKSDFIMDEEHDNWLRKTLEIFVENAYFVPTASAKTSKVPLPPLSDATRKVFQGRLSSCLSRLLRVRMESKISFASLVVGMIRSISNHSKSLQLLFKADEPILKTVDKAFKTLDKITAKHSQGENPAAEGFILLYSLALLQVYDGDGDAVLLLEDLDSSRKALLKKKSSSSSSEGQGAFIEILLTFLGNPRTLFRDIAQEAFTIFAADLTPEGLQSLIDILDTAESFEGQQALFNQGGDEEEESEGESEDDIEDVEDASDVEMVDGELRLGSEGATDESDAESTSESDEEDDEEDSEELARFDEMLANTLKTSGFALKDGATGESDDDEDMDDEQMMALDPHLTKIFQERSKLSSKKKEREAAKETVVQFKSRVLDLLAIFMDKEYSNPLTLDALLPLLRRTRADASKRLADKSYKILKTYTDSRAHHKAPLPKPENLDALWELLKEIQEEVKQGGGSTAHATACSVASLHVAKVLVSVDKANYSRVFDIYGETQKQWFADKKSPVQASFFTQFTNWSVSAQKQGK